VRKSVRALFAGLTTIGAGMAAIGGWMFFCRRPIEDPARTVDRLRGMGGM